jgi:hypothetical protein
MAIDLNLELEEVPIEDYLLATLDMDNIRGGIKQFGFGLNFDFPIQASIRGGMTVPIEAEILAPFIDPPASPLAVHVGQGTVYLGWSHPFPEKVDLYELLFSLNLGGPYLKYPTGEFRFQRGMIKNVPVGLTLYFQLRAVGKNGAFSTLTQVKKGKFYNPLVSMNVRAIRGSSLQAGAIFNSVDPETGLLISIRAPVTILIN